MAIQLFVLLSSVLISFSSATTAYQFIEAESPILVERSSDQSDEIEIQGILELTENKVVYKKQLIKYKNFESRCRPEKNVILNYIFSENKKIFAPQIITQLNGVKSKKQAERLHLLMIGEKRPDSWDDFKLALKKLTNKIDFGNLYNSVVIENEESNRAKLGFGDSSECEFEWVQVNDYEDVRVPVETFKPKKSQQEVIVNIKGGLLLDGESDFFKIDVKNNKVRVEGYSFNNVYSVVDQMTDKSGVIRINVHGERIKKKPSYDNFSVDTKIKDKELKFSISPKNYANDKIGGGKVIISWTVKYKNSFCFLFCNSNENKGKIIFDFDNENLVIFKPNYKEEKDQEPHIMTGLEYNDSKNYGPIKINTHYKIKENDKAVRISYFVEYENSKIYLDNEKSLTKLTPPILLKK